MSLLKVCSFAFVVLLSSHFVHAQTDPIENSIPCSKVVNGTFYNFTSLMGTQMSGHDAGGGWIYYLQMCTVAPACIRDGAMICQSPSNDPNTIYDVAYPDDARAVHYWRQIPGGVALTVFGSGLSCGAFGNERVGVVNLVCDPRYTDPLTTFSSPVVEGPPCTYNFFVNHSTACGVPYVPTVTPGPTTIALPSSSTDQSTVTGAGVGVGIAIGVVITAAATLVYVYVARRGGARPGSKWNKMDEDKGMTGMGTMGGTTSEATNM